MSKASSRSRKRYEKQQQAQRAASLRAKFNESREKQDEAISMLAASAALSFEEMAKSLSRMSSSLGSSWELPDPPPEPFAAVVNGDGDPAAPEDVMVSETEAVPKSIDLSTGQIVQAIRDNIYGNSLIGPDEVRKAAAAWLTRLTNEITSIMREVEDG